MRGAFAKLVYCDSYSRMPALIDIWLSDADRSWCFRALGESWQICDNNSAAANKAFR